MAKRKVKIKPNARGFMVGNFKDDYQKDCSIQMSSLATKACIWLGVDDLDPQILIPGTGWRPYPIPSNVLFHNRMHLDQKQVAALLPLLQKFVETGKLQ